MRKLTFLILIFLAVIGGCSSEELFIPTDNGNGGTDTLVVVPPTVPLSATLVAMPIEAEVPLVVSLHLQAYDGVRPYRFAIWQASELLSNSATATSAITESGTYTFTGFVTDALDSTVEVTASIVATADTSGGDTTTVDCWQVPTDLSVGKKPDQREDSATYSTSADGGEYHLWLRVLWDTRKEYMCWVSFEYTDGTERRFAVPDPHADRPIELILDVGTARVESRQRVRLWREKKGDPHGKACAEEIRLLEIKGCR
ncbi:hypothetical protein ACFL04_04145 [Patescibacteria group bacterium]